MRGTVIKTCEAKDHAPSFLPDGYEFELVWSDEFDGDVLDASKWDYRLCVMGKRHPAWTDRAVRKKAKRPGDTSGLFLYSRLRI